MVLKDPNPKVAYSFRIYDKLLTKIKQYAKANNLSLPQAMNILLENSIKGYTLTNDYIKENTFIIIPYMEHKTYKKLAYLDTGINPFDPSEDLDITNLRREGLEYGVTAIPNNLDIWHPHIGYKAKGENLEHEGISVIICSELIKRNLVKLTSESVKECLKFIHFKQYPNKKIVANLISYKEALMLLNQVENTEIYNYYSEIINLVWAIADKVGQECEALGVAYLENKEPTYKELFKLEKLFNDTHITSLNFANNTKIKKVDFDLYKKYHNELKKEMNGILKDMENLIKNAPNEEAKQEAKAKFEDILKENGIKF